MKKAFLILIAFIAVGCSNSNGGTGVIGDNITAPATSTAP